MLSRILAACLSLCVLAGCTATPVPTQIPLLAKAEAYYRLYAERTDFDAFMAFYAENAELRDMGYGSHLQSKAAIADFFDWNRGDVTVLEGASLSVDNHVVQGNTVVTRGHFTRFMYRDVQMGPWYFVIWLEFDDKGQIVRQTDWINYTPKEQFVGGDNLNRLIQSSGPD